MDALVVLEMDTPHGNFLVVVENSKILMFVVYNFVVKSSKDSNECVDVVGRDTLNFISSLFSASIGKVGIRMVQVLFPLYLKHPTYFICYLILKRDTSKEGE